MAGLPEGGTARQVAALLREYFADEADRLPELLKLPIAAVRSDFLPEEVRATLVRRSMLMIAYRFIVDPSERSIDNVLRRLEHFNRYPSFDLLGEAVLSAPEADAYRKGSLELLDRLGRHRMARQRTPGGRPALEVSIKLTALTAQFNPEAPEATIDRVRGPFAQICDAARSRGIGVTVDAEQFMYRELIWEIIRDAAGPGGPFAEWPDLGMVVQAYLRHSEAHAQDIIEFGRRRGTPLRVRLVKGAYWDYEYIVAEQHSWPVPVYLDKAETDRSFERIVRRVLEAHTAVSLAAGSHNVRSHAYAEAVREALGLPEHTVEHQTLYRTLEHLSRALPLMGWSARDYIPSGERIPGMAYLVRRILENTSQAGFLTQQRRSEDPAKLLSPPAPAGEDETYRRPQYATGFLNDPEPRLFDHDERAQMDEALESTRERWGAEYPLVFGGESVSGHESVASHSPSHPAEVVGRVHFAGAQQADAAIAMANKGARKWAETAPSERASIGLRAAAILRERRHEIAAWVVHEGGRTRSEALADVGEAIDHIEWNARELLRQEKTVRDDYRPRGVVGVISPWNFPIALPARMVSAALMAGNAVILKPSEQTPIVTQKLVEALHQAGAPRDALIHLPGRGETVGRRLVDSPDVDMIAFTGSKAVGVSIYKSESEVSLARGGIKRTITEMGGKNPIIVFPDADMDEAVASILTSAFGHAGQKCSACSRVIVHHTAYGRLVLRLIQAARSLVVGPADDPDTFINPMIDEEAKARVLRYGDIARQEGNVLLDMQAAGPSGSLCVGPMIVHIAPEKASTSRIMQEEIFGPVLAVTQFSTERDATDLANSVPYSLTAGIFSRSPATVRRVTQELNAGNIYVNRKITGARVGIEPFGGFNFSGTGPKAGGEDYLLAFMTRSESLRTGASTSIDSSHSGQVGSSENRRNGDSASLSPLPSQGRGPGG